jgi:hypothetical protein
MSGALPHLDGAGRKGVRQPTLQLLCPSGAHARWHDDEDGPMITEEPAKGDGLYRFCGGRRAA